MFYDEIDHLKWITSLMMPGYPPVLKMVIAETFAGAKKLAVNSAMSFESGEGANAKNIAMASSSICFKRILLLPILSRPGTEQALFDNSGFIVQFL